MQITKAKLTEIGTVFMKLSRGMGIGAKNRMELAEGTQDIAMIVYGLS